MTKQTRMTEQQIYDIACQNQWMLARAFKTYPYRIGIVYTREPGRSYTEAFCKLFVDIYDDPAVVRDEAMEQLLGLVLLPRHGLWGNYLPRPSSGYLLAGPNDTCIGMIFRAGHIEVSRTSMIFILRKLNVFTEEEAAREAASVKCLEYYDHVCGRG